MSRSLSWLLIIRGVLAILFGILALVWPGLTVVALAFLFAIWIIVDGIGMVISGISGSSAGMRIDGGRRVLYVLAGLVGIAAGIGVFVWPGIGVLVLALFAGAWAVVTGIGEIAAGIRLRKEMTGEWLLILAGVLSVIVGILILLLPGIGAIVLAQVLGVYAVVVGIVLLVAGFRVRRYAVSRSSDQPVR